MIHSLPFCFGSEVHTWFMSQDGHTHANRLGHMVEIIAQAGFKGIQPIYSWMGDLNNADLLEEKLNKHNIELAVLIFLHQYGWLKK